MNRVEEIIEILHDDSSLPDCVIQEIKRMLISAQKPVYTINDKIIIRSNDVIFLKEISNIRFTHLYDNRYAIMFNYLYDESIELISGCHEEVMKDYEAIKKWLCNVKSPIIYL